MDLPFQGWGMTGWRPSWKRKERHSEARIQQVLRSPSQDPSRQGQSNRPALQGCGRRLILQVLFQCRAWLCPARESLSPSHQSKPLKGQHPKIQPNRHIQVSSPQCALGDATAFFPLEGQFGESQYLVGEIGQAEWVAMEKEGGQILSREGWVVGSWLVIFVRVVE